MCIENLQIVRRLLTIMYQMKKRMTVHEDLQRKKDRERNERNGRDFSDYFVEM